MTIKVKLSFEDYYQCMYQLSYKKIYIIGYTIGFIFFLSVVFYFILPIEDFPFGPLGGSLASVLIPIFLKRNLKKSFESNKLIQDEITYDFQEDYVFISSENFQSKILWSDYFQIKETKNFILLYQSNQVANFIPKEAIANQLDNFKALAKAKCSKVKFR
jgi:hypothetical protein